MTFPQKGDTAPDFTLPTDGGADFSLAEHRGKKVVLFFYPKDDTSGCTAEALAFTALKDEFSGHGAVVVGISPDNVKKHAKFRDKHELDVILASDEEKKVLETYGVWVEKSMYGRKYMGVQRSTVLVGEDGTVLESWWKVKVPGHAEAVLAAVESA
ncbi:peroxiredoxin [Notoacmeibacter sp. MSK16QG-6]|uniref:peroxiredoxin n=1 Tax=Notoacmeibacter sp. MSK16QG-6 TaxID=2957982 RepID=UPI00209FB453|nr:peroxiredoxin [Notoacmeibacter sp. MSK16QG-6]MCP1197839.1 peroxiredoxin [Notoacmeibacter sp. MSK16QG-6]